MIARFALPLLLLFSALAQGAESVDVDELIAQRLKLMKAVAAHKWRHELPVEDVAREQQVLEASTLAGLDYGLTRKSSRAFFRVQIEAAKEIQTYWLQRWQGGATPPEVADLESEIRPRLLALGEQIIAATAAGEIPVHQEFVEQLALEGLSRESAEAIYEALADLTFYPDRLTQVLESGVLRIGTTGDYPPFSYRADDDTPFIGVDIDLGRNLAAALGVAPVFVHTSWPGLMTDLKNGKFDIAMSGVSRTLERQRWGFFSRPYHIGGKTAVFRCGESARFDSLPAIDRPDVRVIVNPGGTNERFVDTRIGRAQKVLHQDNRTIFAEIVEGRADVMITDRVEADWQAERNPALCAPLTSNFTYQEKAYLMPREVALKEFVDTWLALRIAEGKLTRPLSPPP